jgi:gluconolactonase
VFRISPDRDTLTLLVDDLLAPNGIAFSPDEKVLYVNDSRRRHIRAFDLQPNGTLARQTDRVFCELGGPEPSIQAPPNGLTTQLSGSLAHKESTSYLGTPENLGTLDCACTGEG